LLAAACLGVPFIAGAKLLDSVRPAKSQSTDVGNERGRMPPRRISRSRPRDRRSAPDLALRSSHHID
jgi:hypothetical protein